MPLPPLPHAETLREGVEEIEEEGVVRRERVAGGEPVPPGREGVAEAVLVAAAVALCAPVPLPVPHILFRGVPVVPPEAVAGADAVTLVVRRTLSVGVALPPPPPPPSALPLSVALPLGVGVPPLVTLLLGETEAQPLLLPLARTLARGLDEVEPLSAATAEVLPLPLGEGAAALPLTDSVAVPQPLPLPEGEGANRVGVGAPPVGEAQAVAAREAGAEAVALALGAAEALPQPLGEGDTRTDAEGRGEREALAEGDVVGSVGVGVARAELLAVAETVGIPTEGD